MLLVLEVLLYSGPSLVGEEGVELAYNKSTSSMRLLGSNGPEVTI